MEPLNKILLEAARNNDVETVKSYIKNGANVNYKSKSETGETPLHWAAYNSNFEIVDLLISNGADINSQDNCDRRTPLHLAAVRCDTDIVALLISKGADINIKDEAGETALDWAREKGDTHLLLQLITLGVDVRKAAEAVKNCYSLQEAQKYLQIPIGDDGQQSEKDDALTKIEDAITFKTLLSDGTYESYGNRIYLAGACRVGKSTLACLLIGDEIPLSWRSTDGLRIFFGKNGIDLKTLQMVPLKKGKGDRDVLSRVLRGHPDMKQDQSKKKVQEVAVTEEKSDVTFQSGDADLNSLNPGNSFAGRVPSQTSSLEPVKQKLPKIEFFQIHEDIKAEIKNGEYKVHIAPSDLVDFGGQKSYDMTHQLFIQGKGTFTLMFDGRKRLKEPLKDEYPAGDVTTESILRHWVDSILTYCGVDDDDILPVILFAATYRDCVTNKDEQSAKIKEYKEGLSTMFQEHERKDRIKYNDIFFINATDKNDPEVERLKAKYVDIAIKQNSWGKHTPMAWVPLELQMSLMREKNITLIAKEELENMNKGNGDLALKEKELNRFLKEQHLLGKIMYYEGQGLDKYIIVQPSSVIDILRSFITDEMFFPKDINLAQILKDLKKTGKISKKDLFRLWTQDEFNQHMPSEDSKEFVAKVLAHLDLLVEPKSDKAQRNFFLVPCMVTQKPSTDLIDDLKNDQALFMSYKLSKSMPSALTFKLIGAVLNVWPLKETENGICLYHKAAILNITEDNELRILGKDERVVVCLVNKTVKGFISPDIASTTQECLTLAMTTALDFYHNSFGKIVSSSQIFNLLQIEVGEKCKKGMCYISLTEAKTVSFWRCSSGIEHKTERLLHWIYDRKQERCTENCKGLDETALSAYPSEKHLVRLAGKIEKETCMDLVITLGLPKHQWNDICDQENSVMMIKFMALWKWKMHAKARQRPTFKLLRDALMKAELNSHWLCEIFREFEPLLQIQNEMLQQKPDDDTLQKLSRRIGDCAWHLGVELGLETPEIEETINRYRKDTFEQNCDILTKWSKSGTNTTVRCLMQALHFVYPKALNFLESKYNICLI